MITDVKKEKILRELSQVTIEGIKKLSSKGKGLDGESLFEVVREYPEIYELFSVPDEKSDVTYSDDAKEIERLKIEIDRLGKQKEKLIRQLDEMEQRAAEHAGLYRKILLFFNDILRPGEGDPLCDNINQFKRLLKRGAGAETLESAFLQLKNAFIRHGGDYGSIEVPKSPGKFLPAWIKKKSGAVVREKYIQRFREAYQDIIDEVGLDVGPEFLNKLQMIRRRIGSVDTFDDFDALRQDILSFLHEYMSSINFEREKAGEFIKDIWIRLVEVEKNLYDAFEISGELINSGGEFDKHFNQDLDTLKRSLDISGSIDELKEVFYAKLDGIRRTIQAKSEKDNASRKVLYNNIARLRNDFARMKREASSARENMQVLEHELHIDPLTGAANRRAYDKRINQEIARFKRYRHVFSVLILDVDHFKHINDRYGHATGDKCLKEMIRRLKPVLRESDMLARFGGEEFVAVLPETNRAGALEVAEKLRQTVANIKFLHKDEVVKITISIGVTEINSEDDTAEGLFSRMDMALYEAKNCGRNQVVFR